MNMPITRGTNSPTSAALASLLALLVLSSCGVTVNAPNEQSGRVLQSQPAPHDQNTALPAPDTVLELTKGYLQRPDGTKIWYEVAGEGEPLVLIHGLGGNHAVWYRQFPELAREFRVITFSQRGFAPSTGAGEKADPTMLAADLAALLDLLEIERAAIVGQSMGGWTALSFALRFPHRTTAIVLADTTGGIFDDFIERHYQAVLEKARELSTQPPILASHPALDPQFCRKNPEEAWLYQSLASFGAPRPGAIAENLGRNAIDHSRLHGNKVPVFFIVGERDRIFPPQIIQRAAGYIDDSRVEVIANAGHSPYFETPEVWRQVMTEFLRSVPSSITTDGADQSSRE
jgi:3-oxoadipate enol-lactonase